MKTKVTTSNITRNLIIGLLIISIALVWNMYRVYNNEINEYKSRISLLERDNSSLESKMNELMEFNTQLMSIRINRLNKLNDVYRYMNKKDRSLAEIVVNAANEYELDPLLLTALINSESSFDTTAEHKLKYVVGLGGTNTRYWEYPVDTPQQQIHATAIILKFYLDKYEDIVKALKAYKGWSPKGERQAKLVYKKYLELAER